MYLPGAAVIQQDLVAHAEHGELYAADLMTVFYRHKMCVWL